MLWVKRPFETVLQSISVRLPERGRERREWIEESKNVQTPPTHTYCKRSRPLPYCHPNCRMPDTGSFTQDHSKTRSTLRVGILTRLLKFQRRTRQASPLVEIQIPRVRLPYPTWTLVMNCYSLYLECTNY